MPTLTQLITISDSAEPIPTYVTPDERYLYAVLNYGGNPASKGRIVKLDLSQSPPTITEIASVTQLAMWQQAYVNEKNKIYAFGEAQWTDNILRACAAVVDVGTDSFDYVCHTQTGDTNEFIGVTYDKSNKRFIVGERRGGGDTTGSSYPNGGGLWIIPIEDVLNPDAWQRVHEFTPWGADTLNPAVWSVVATKDTVFVALRGSSTSRIMKAPIDNLASWTLVEDMTHITGLGYWGRRIAYVSTDPNTGNAVLKYSDDGGATWNTIDLGMTPTTLSTFTPPQIFVMLYGKYAIISGVCTEGAKLLLVDVDSGTVTQLGNLATEYTPIIVGTQRNNKIYIGAVKAYSQTPSYIYVLTLDVRYILSLSVSNANPAPGETITLEAKLVDDQGTPVQGAEIEFYLVTNKIDDRHYGELIGTALTDTSGTARLQYTLPTSVQPGDVLVFRAVYKG